MPSKIYMSLVESPLMDNDDYNKLYLISYLIANRKDEKISGYSDLAARLAFLDIEIEEDPRLNDEYRSEIDEMIYKEDNNGLDWTNLKDLIERASDDDYGVMFLDVRASSVGPDKWVYEFHSTAPMAILEKKIEKLIGPENETRFIQKVIKAAQTDDEDLVERVYNQ